MIGVINGTSRARFLQAYVLLVATSVLTASAASGQGVCGDFDANGRVAVSDTLRHLRAVVGDEVTLSCPRGLSCWDTNENSECDLTTEDIDMNGTCTVADCRGPKGEPGDAVFTSEEVGTLLTHEERIAEIERLTNVDPERDRHVFVTFDAYSGPALGSLAEADRLCQLAAKSANLPGVYKAWLSGVDSVGQDVGPALGRFSTNPDARYVISDGTGAKRVVAVTADPSMLTTLLSPISITELGTEIDEEPVWTGTSASGTPLSDNCSNWTSGRTLGVVGLAGRTDGGWTQDLQPQECTGTARLYCFQQ